MVPSRTASPPLAENKDSTEPTDSRTQLSAKSVESVFRGSTSAVLPGSTSALLRGSTSALLRGSTSALLRGSTSAAFQGSSSGRGHGLRTARQDAFLDEGRLDEADEERAGSVGAAVELRVELTAHEEGMLVLGE